MNGPTDPPGQVVALPPMDPAAQVVVLPPRRRRQASRDAPSGETHGGRDPGTMPPWVVVAGWLELVVNWWLIIVNN